MMKRIFLLLIAICIVSLSEAQLRISFEYDDKNQLIEYSLQNSYAVSLEYDASGNRTTLSIEDLSSVSSIIEKADIKAWPNPFSEELFVQVNSQIQGHSVSLFSLTGQLMQIDYSVEEGIIRIRNLSALPEGIYFLNVRNQSGEQRVKLLKL